MPLDVRAIREEFFRRFSNFTQHMYLLCFAVGHISEADLRVVASEIGEKVQALAEAGDPLWNDNVEGDVKKLRKSLPGIATFVLELLIIKLDAMLHELLDSVAGRFNTDSAVEYSRSFEEELGRVKEESPEAYKWLILLAEIRNAAVHNGSVLNSGRFNRLRAAGWNDEELELLSKRIPDGLTVSDVLKMKGAVRTSANLILEAHGSRREDL